jgi:hypothetical protein
MISQALKGRHTGDGDRWDAPSGLGKFVGAGSQGVALGCRRSLLWGLDLSMQSFQLRRGLDRIPAAPGSLFCMNRTPTGGHCDRIKPLLSGDWWVVFRRNSHFCVLAGI